MQVRQFGQFLASSAQKQDQNKAILKVLLVSYQLARGEVEQQKYVKNQLIWKVRNLLLGIFLMPCCALIKENIASFSFNLLQRRCSQGVHYLAV